MRQLIFTSTNCLWASNLGRPVTEDEPPNPVELYGRSKLAAEEALKPYEADLNVITIRCPTIIDSGRLGLLAILFEFIHDNKKVWVVGSGGNRYQFIYAQDLATACIQAMDYPRSELFHIGSDDVCSLREVYEAVIRDAGTRARVAQLPKAPTIAAMKLAHRLGVSPLGPYHYRMIAEDFIFDTAPHPRAPGLAADPDQPADDDRGLSLLRCATQGDPRPQGRLRALEACVDGSHPAAEVDLVTSFRRILPDYFSARNVDEMRPRSSKTVLYVTTTDANR